MATIAVSTNNEEKPKRFKEQLKLWGNGYSDLFKRGWWLRSVGEKGRLATTLLLRITFGILVCCLELPAQRAVPPNPQPASLTWIDSKGATMAELASGVALCAPITIYVNPDSKTKIPSGASLRLLVGSDAAKPSPIKSGTLLITDAKSKTPTATLLTLAIKNKTAVLTGLSAGEHSFIATLVGDGATAGPPSPAVSVTVEQTFEPSVTCVKQMPPIILTAVGVNVEAASSTSPRATFLGVTALDFPIRLGTSFVSPMKNIHDANFFLSGSLRIAGMAQPGTLSASAFTSAYYATAVNSTPDKIVQSWEGSVSASWVITKTYLGIGTFDEGSVPSPSYPRSTLLTTSFLLSGGFNSPLSASQASPPVYYATTLIQSQFTPTSGSWPATCAVTTGNPPCYVTFIPSDRTRFYRYYEAGLRLRIYGEDYTHKILRHPGTVDITFGQNEYVTGGGFRGVVAHLAGVMPIPLPKVSGFYAFGSIASELNGQVGSGTQLLLSPVPSTANVNYLSNNVFDVSVSQPNRDRYRFGFGIDLFQLLSNSKAKVDSTSTPGGSPANAAP